MQKLLNKMDAVIISAPMNLLYFTGLENSDALALYYQDTKYYFTSESYYGLAGSNLHGYLIKNIDEIFSFIESKNIKSIGIESSLDTDIQLKFYQVGVNTLFNIDFRLQKIRAIKDSTELEFIKKAQEITDKTFEDLLPSIREGMSEIELATILESLLHKNGANGLAFESIVAFDKNTAIPHAVRSMNTLKNGSLITLDFGAKYQGYCSDMTRTIAFGDVTDEEKKAYEYVSIAQEMALSIMHAGMTGKECDSMARLFFAEKGLDKYFIHTLGHSIGLEVHEFPRLSQKDTTVLEENMVVTVEPGLYFDGYFGIRIEDLVILNKTDIINLTKSPKKLIII